MNQITWQPRYEVGIPEIDEQHRKLVELIARLQESLMLDGSELGGPIVGEILKELVAYAHDHFKFEEEYMARMKYSGLDAHRKHHRALAGEIRETLQNLKEGGDLTKIELIEFLKHWLVDHILAEDKKIGRELQDKIANANRGF